MTQDEYYGSERGVLVSERSVDDVRDVGDMRKRRLLHGLTDWGEGGLARAGHCADNDDAVRCHEQAGRPDGLADQSGGVSDDAPCTRIPSSEQFEQFGDADSLVRSARYGPPSAPSSQTGS